MRFPCIIDTVISEREGIIKHSSIYKGRLAGSLRVSEWDRHFQEVRYSQFRRRRKNKNKFPGFWGSANPHEPTSSLQMNRPNTHWTKFSKCLHWHLGLDTKYQIFTFLFLLQIRVAGDDLQDKAIDVLTLASVHTKAYQHYAIS